MEIANLKTPCAIIDLDILERNASVMTDRARRLGVKLRPHVKTHKCIEAAKIQTMGTSGAITVSTFAEARFFFEGGFSDITCAVPISMRRIPEAVESSCSGKFSLILDDERTLEELERFGKALRLRFSAFLKVDCGYGRAGVDPESDNSVKFAIRLARSPSIDFRGILTHAGQSYNCRNTDEAKAVASIECTVMARFAQMLRETGVEVPEVSVGSTPTVVNATSMDGVTEIRPGNYIFFDAFQAAIGNCGLQDCAFTVLATVIGSYPERRTLVLDAGALALSKDPGPTHIKPYCGYGILMTPDCKSDYRALRFGALSQEQGTVTSTNPKEIERLPVGSKVRIIPNHSCLAAACFESYTVIRGHSIVAEWKPCKWW